MKLQITNVCILLAASFGPSELLSQTSVTFHQQIQPIINKNCTPCHRPSGSAPFNLITYDDVARRAQFIKYVTETRYMPPWKADIEFQRYSNERWLTDEELKLIDLWIKQGKKKGKKIIENEFQELDEFQKPDMVIEMNLYSIPTQNKDDFRFFCLPSNLTEDKFVRKIEFIPGNKRLVHHSRIMIDTTNKVREIDGLSADDPNISKFEKYPPVDKFFFGWVPGNFTNQYPTGSAKRLYKNSDILLNVHYAPNAKLNQTDQSRINLYFTNKPVQSEVYSLAIAEESISNPPFVIPANETKKFYSKYGPIPVDIYPLSVLPHMHYLGKTFKSYAITPDGDVVFLVKINDWDFRWQETYWFKDEIVIPRGSIIYIEAEFDNTTKNLANPSSPPIDVTYGWNTKSEMLDMVIYFLLQRIDSSTSN